MTNCEKLVTKLNNKITYVRKILVWCNYLYHIVFTLSWLSFKPFGASWSYRAGISKILHVISLIGTDYTHASTSSGLVTLTITFRNQWISRPLLYSESQAGNPPLGFKNNTSITSFSYIWDPCYELWSSIAHIQRMLQLDVHKSRI